MHLEDVFLFTSRSTISFDVTLFLSHIGTMHDGNSGAWDTALGDVECEDIVF